MSETIHSGHFMRSKVHDLPADSSDEDAEIDVVTSDTEEPHTASSVGTQIDRADEKPVTFYKFGPTRTKSIAIDVSLGKINKCLHMAYDKLTTPKWKNFNGLRLSWKQRIRLNNVIWRLWHLEFVTKVRSKYCCFSLPCEPKNREKMLEAPVVEGMYWKRRLDAVVAQYKRWRSFNPSHRHRSKGVKRRMSHTNTEPLLAKLVDDQALVVPYPQTSASQQPLVYLETDEMSNPFTDRLFECLSQNSYMFPDPKEMAQAGNADIIQPSLIQLQPSLEDIMASLDATYPMMNDDPTLCDSSTSEEPLYSQIGGDGKDSAAVPVYTPKDYEDASLLIGVQSKKSLMEIGTSLAIPAKTVQPRVLYSQAVYETNSSYINQESNSLSMEPYVPQMATMSSGAMGRKLGVWQKAPTKTFPANSLQPRLKSSPAGRRRRSGNPRPLSSTVLPSAFSPVSPTSLASTRPSSSPGTADLRSPGSRLATPLSQSFFHVSPTSTANNVLQSPSNQPLLIVQPCSNVHVPLISLPYLAMSPPITTASMTSPSSAKYEVESWPSQPLIRTQSSSSLSDCSWQLKGTKRAAADSTMGASERKRMQHLVAEQSRRSALKGGFDQLENLLPNMLVGGAKPTNAVVLARACDYIRELKERLSSKKQDFHLVSHEMKHLQNKISAYQTHLPVAGAATGASQSPLQLRYEKYVRERTLQDWRFWLLRKMMDSLFESYKAEVQGEAAEALRQSAGEWASKHCHLLSLRPMASQTLVELATDTPILAEPDQLPKFLLDKARSGV